MSSCRQTLVAAYRDQPADRLLPRALAAFVRQRSQTRLFFDLRRYEGVIEGVSGRVAELGFALGLSNHVGIAHEVVYRGEMVCVMTISTRAKRSRRY
jgi:DNA-binding transcriptional LysR family regulator